ncbi:nucleotide sugar dehydrogenase [Cytophaga aurantiaca]|uniref:nucleotide sugar dehydrogenase n=1 Tax=Cytophaga aurantiaca TaxID=29530 RepID=UPI0003696A8F|nr:nucleotide sugar dehydrogenase [Cytophaga aurantiaca]
MNAFSKQFVEKKQSLAVIGLGYVGLPIALAFAKKIKVIGFDINSSRIELMKKDVDPSGELNATDFQNSEIVFTNDLTVLKEASFYIVTVPTPIDTFNHPDLTPLISATKTIGKVLKKGDYVVYESTVYPGCTEEECVPLLEELSGLTFGKDFKVGYSPERINPGDKEHTLSKIIKVVAGCDQESLNAIADVYELVVDAGIHKASSIKVAEAAKIIENTQRDVNIALMNELSIICDKLDINTYEVLEAARTKWNFLPFTPGLVGGHCIGVDPYYLTYKARKLGLNPNVILSGRLINDQMPMNIAKKIVTSLIKSGKDISKSRVLVLGVTFKENVEDIRNSKVAELIKELQSYSLNIDAVDPYASFAEFKHEYNLEFETEISGMYDVAILAVPHKEYLTKDIVFFEKMINEKGLFVDIKGVYRKSEHKKSYWTL